MDITWYGLSCFRIREDGVTVVCDPFDKSVGKMLPQDEGGHRDGES